MLKPSLCFRSMSLAFIHAGVATPLAADPLELPAALTASAQAYLDSCVEDGGAPGAALIFANEAGDTAFLTVGFENIAEERLFTPSTRTSLHSVSKIFAGLIAAQLVSEGKLNIDLPISTYLPMLRFRNGYENQVTMRHLLTHRSGLALENEDIATGWGYVAAGPDLHFLFPPGAEGKSNYSNIGYSIAGAAFEQIEGKPLDAIVADRITGPLGMTGARMRTDPMDDQLATQYTARNYGFPYNSHTPLVPFVRPFTDNIAWGVTASLDDLAKLMADLLRAAPDQTGNASGSPSLVAGNYDLLTEVAKGDEAESYRQTLGLRWMDAPGGGAVLGHSGDWAGGRTTVDMAPDIGLGAAMFINVNGRCDAPEISAQLLAEARALRNGTEIPPPYAAKGWRLSDLREIAAAQDYVGTYLTAEGRSLSFEADGQTLFLIDGPRRIALENPGPQDAAEDRFVEGSLEGPLRELQFARNDDGSIASLVIRKDLYLPEGIMHDPAPAAPAGWERLEGLYRNDRATPYVYDYYLRQGRLYLRAHWWNGEYELTPVASDAPDEVNFVLGDAAEPEAWFTFKLVGDRPVYATMDGNPFEKVFPELPGQGE